MRNRSARPKLNLSRETLKRLEESLELAAAGGTTVASNTSACSAGGSCVTCTRPYSFCEC